MWVRPEKSYVKILITIILMCIVLSFLNCYYCCKKLFHPYINNCFSKKFKLDYFLSIHL